MNAPVSGLIILPTVNKNTYSNRSITSLVIFLSFSLATTSYFNGLPHAFFSLLSLLPLPSCNNLNISRFLNDAWSLAKNFHFNEFKITLISDSSVEALSYLTNPLRMKKKLSLADSSKWCPQPLRSSR
jgi:hypothetical protein